MQPFTQHRGRVAVLDWSDVNTDLIIPARYLKRIERTGYGNLLFADKKYAAGQSPQIDDPNSFGALDPAFPLNKPELKGATVLVAGRNFGCGSSREHAVWAVSQAGYRAVIAPGRDEGFADIFEGNSRNNGLLPVELADDDWKAIADAGQKPGGAEVTIDLEKQTVILHAEAGDRSFSFDIPESDRNRMLKGLDFIAETLLDEPAITVQEKSMPAWITPVGA